MTDKLGAQGTVCAGGRYNGLVEQLGGKSTPAVGFAMGIERLVLLLEELNVLPEGLEQNVDAFLMVVGNVQIDAVKLAEQLRSDMPYLRLQVHCGGGNYKSQMKKALKSGADVALVLAEGETETGEITSKYLTEEKPQKTVAWTDLAAELVNS